MKKYKGYTIEKITRKDWIIKKNGNWDAELNGEKISASLKEAKTRIDSKENK